MKISDKYLNINSSIYSLLCSKFKRRGNNVEEKEKLILHIKLKLLLQFIELLKKSDCQLPSARNKSKSASSASLPAVIFKYLKLPKKASSTKY